MTLAAVGQICSTTSMAHNLEQCIKLVTKAAAAGAKVLFLPEASDYIATSSEESLSLARSMTTSLFVVGLRGAAAKNSIAVHVGIHVPIQVQPAGGATSATSTSNPVLTAVPEPKAVSGAATKLYNRSIWINADGSLKEAASYDKLHLFEYGASRESNTIQAGSKFTDPFPSPIGRIGSLICFDLRFPEAALHLARPPPSSPFAAAPAQILLYPSAFTVPTGRAHWEVLLRARAVETQSYVVAAAQIGRHAGKGGKRVSYGRSMVVDPWGRILLEMKGVKGETEGEWEAEDGAVGELGLFDVDLGEWERVRESMPLVRRT